MMRDHLMVRCARLLEELAVDLRRDQTPDTLRQVVVRLEAIHQTLRLVMPCRSELAEQQADC